MKKKERQGEEKAKAEEQKEQKAQKAQKKRRKGPSVSTIVLVFILLAGAGIMAYPSVSDWWNSMHATRAIAGYAEAVESLSDQEREAILTAAHQYNESLENGTNFALTDEQLAEYDSLLDITGTGIMGYIQISA